MQLPKYPDIADALQRVHSPLDPSEAHGMLCAMICAGDKIHQANWASTIFGRVDDSDEACLLGRAKILSLFKYSFEQLTSMAFEFNILLPDDEQTLAARSHSLGLWCQGFVTGLQAAGVTMKEAHSAEARDALLHFAGIAEIDFDHIDVSEEDEKCYFEVSEYVRMAVLMVYSELAGAVSVAIEDMGEEVGTVH